jgi:hypothetical protein
MKVEKLILLLQMASPSAEVWLEGSSDYGEARFVAPMDDGSLLIRRRNKPATGVAASLGTIVHVLAQGHALCGLLPGHAPSAWPPGHLWTRLANWEMEATCLLCRKVVLAIGRS